MRRTSLAVALCTAAAAVACGRSPQPSTGSGIAKGRPGQYYYVNLFTPPLGGIVTSDVGGASCGASAVAVDGTVDPPQYVYTYYGSGSDRTDHCGQIQIPWTASVTLTAAGQGGNAFLGWAGDCAGTGPCTLSPGADKTVVALFGPPGSGHPNFTAPATHGPAYFAFLAGESPLRCTACHGASLEGQGIAPACAECHARAGWAGWQSNCSFCHGARTPAAQAGYQLASHPDWAAPPDALSQRLTGLAAPDRTGAHQAHLRGVTPGGLSVAPAFACATCHPVPSDLSHVGGAAHRAEVVLSGAGQASLPASLGHYDPGTGTCATYCHGAAASPAWSSTGLACGGCHAAPPPDPHPYTGADLTACAACHGETMGPGGAITPGGTHLDGVIQATGGHPDFTLPSVHGPAFLDRLGARPGSLGCTGCHGATYDGGLGPSCNACHAASGWAGWRSNCSFCHGTRDAGARAGYDVAARPTWSAPPDAVAERLDPAHAPVPARTGAHQAHLTGATAGGASFARPFACSTCHAVPGDLSHVGGAASRATVLLRGSGQASLPADLGSYDEASGTCATSCHGAGPSPAWSATGLQCGGCHALPPSTASGHPDVPPGLAGCALCHADTVLADGTLDVAGGTHVNGVVDLAGGHGDLAPPSLHGPAFFDALAGASPLDCQLCHGAGYQGGFGPSCTACHAASGWTGWQANCSFCHGVKNASTRSGYAVDSHPTWSAPPDAVSQRLTGVPAPARTGAHLAHLTGATAGGLAVAAPFACATCHAVPADLTHIGGSTSRATVALSGAGQGSLPAALGSYDQASGTCATSCHGSGRSPAWSATGLQCGACHALPPAPAGGHPDVPPTPTGCALCHPGTVRADGTLDAGGGLHVNGAVDLGGGHGDLAAPSVHGPAALDFLGGGGTLDCQACHGGGLDGGYGPSCNACHASIGWSGWQANCSFCHGTRSAGTKAGYEVAAHPSWSAPPDAVSQRLDPLHAAAPARTGAHQAHLGGATAAGVSFALPFACATCHAVPTNLLHVGGSTSRATVALQGAGQGSLPAALGTYDQASGTCATACHGDAPSPAWATTGLACGACHALPPAPASGHPTVPSALTGCWLCHPETMRADGALDVAGGKHVNGVKEASGGHGDYTSPAVHGPAALDRLGGHGTLDCARCHGAAFDGGVGPSCNACHAASGWTGWQANCSFCHGATSAAAKAGYAVASQPTWSAPPDAVVQRLTGAAAPARTGAHQAHLTGATASGLAFAPPFACATCHAVPADLSHVGGSASRATVALSGAGQASLPAALGTYDQASGACATYCHGAVASPAWSATGLQCGACHALPPPPASGHPSVPATLTGCFLCHPDTVRADGTLLLPGGRHLDGVKDASGGHGDYASPTVHGPAFFDGVAGKSTLDCQACHGATYAGGVGPSCTACHQAAGWTGWQTNCSFCHGVRSASTRAGYAVASQPTWSAPPDAVSQRLTGVAAPARTGAHLTHLTGTTAGGQQLSRPFACQTCHAVPADLSHVGGAGARATVTLAGAGQATLPAALGSYAQATGTCASYCHGATLQGGTRTGVVWTDTNLACNACHFIASPPAPHPAVDGAGTAITTAAQCSQCHPDTVRPDGTIDAAGGSHVNGAVDGGGHADFTAPATHGPAYFAFLRGTGLDCQACHGQDLGGGLGGAAPSCNACHAAAGWTGWSTNCSFCHGLKDATAKAGYALAAHPTWSAPPDALSQRLDGAPAPGRTGAHQIHLTGSAIAGPFACATCHVVPTTSAHAGGPGRAPVVLSGAGQASLPAALGTYSQATGSCTTACHAFTPVAWSGGALGCDGCHTAPPHTGEHDMHFFGLGRTCSECHATAVSAPRAGAPYGAILGLHVNGRVDVGFSAPGTTWSPGARTCTSACHPGASEVFTW